MFKNIADKIVEAQQTQAYIVNISPDIARTWLSQNVNINREIKTATVKKYEQYILNNNWHFTGDTIKFTSDHVLIDGQHRLKAIINSGKTIPQLVVLDIQRSAFAGMDRANPRKGNDTVDTLAKQYGWNIWDKCTVSSVVNKSVIYLHYRNYGTRRHGLDNDTFVACLNQFPEFIEAVDYVNSIFNDSKILKERRREAATVYFLVRAYQRQLNQFQADYLQRMLEDFICGLAGHAYNSPVPGDPRVVLLDRIWQGMHKKTTGNEGKSIAWLTAFLDCWNKFFNHNQNMKRISYTPMFPKVEPGLPLSQYSGCGYGF